MRKKKGEAEESKRTSCTEIYIGLHFGSILIQKPYIHTSDSDKALKEVSNE